MVELLLSRGSNAAAVEPANYEKKINIFRVPNAKIHFSRPDTLNRHFTIEDFQKHHILKSEVNQVSHENRTNTTVKTDNGNRDILGRECGEPWKYPFLEKSCPRQYHFKYHLNICPSREPSQTSIPKHGIQSIHKFIVS